MKSQAPGNTEEGTATIYFKEQKNLEYRDRSLSTQLTTALRANYDPICSQSLLLIWSSNSDRYFISESESLPSTQGTGSTFWPVLWDLNSGSLTTCLSPLLCVNSRAASCRTTGLLAASSSSWLQHPGFFLYNHPGLSRSQLSWWPPTTALTIPVSNCDKCWTLQTI